MTKAQKLSRYAKTLLRQCPTDHWGEMPGNIRPSNPTIKTLRRRNLIEIAPSGFARTCWRQRPMTIEEATMALLDVLPNTAKTLDAHPACEEIKRLRRLLEVE